MGSTPYGASFFVFVNFNKIGLAMENKAFRLEHSDSRIHCLKAYGMHHHPIFTDREKAEKFMKRCVRAWPLDIAAQRMYSIKEYESVAAATADGHGQIYR
jgi:hypothetical protein